MRITGHGFITIDPDEEITIRGFSFDTDEKDCENAGVYIDAQLTAVEYGIAVLLRKRDELKNRIRPNCRPAKEVIDELLADKDPELIAAARKWAKDYIKELLSAIQENEDSTHAPRQSVADVAVNGPSPDSAEKLEILSVLLTDKTEATIDEMIAEVERLQEIDNADKDALEHALDVASRL